MIELMKVFIDMSSFLTIDQQGNSDHTVSRSRFLGCCVHVDSEDEVTTVLNAIKKEYWDAKHHCYAYVLGNDGGRARYSDDGEPGGTAGLPILNAIKTKNLTNTLVVVTRYFGGVLLGTGGLVRAYTKAASDAISNATLVSMKECAEFRTRVSYSLWPKINGFFSDNCISVDTEYSDIVTVTGIVELADYEAFGARLFDRSEGQLKPELIETKLVAVKKV